MPIADQPFNLHSFRQVIGDPARPYLFIVHIPEIGTDVTMTSLAKSASLPGFQLGKVNVAFQGMNIKIGAPPSDIPDWKVEFICDEAHELRNIFMRWQSLVYDPGTMLLSHSNSYKSDQIGVAQMARNGQKVAIFNLIGAFPANVSEITVAQDQGQAIETFSVDFSMDYYVKVANFGDDATGVAPFIRTAQSVRIDRGAPPPGGQWITPFNPQ
jgi:hypothetical protein